MGGKSISDTVQDTLLSRRSFLKWSVALGGAAALAGGVKFGLTTSATAAGAGGFSRQVGRGGLLEQLWRTLPQLRLRSGWRGDTPEVG